VLPEHSIKNHPSLDSNKRGLHREWMFIAINGRTWTLEDPDEIVPMIIRVTFGEISTEEFAERVALSIEEWFLGSDWDRQLLRPSWTGA
jgi:prophage maintenance system killer protein